MKRYTEELKINNSFTELDKNAMMNIDGGEDEFYDSLNPLEKVLWGFFNLIFLPYDGQEVPDSYYC